MSPEAILSGAKIASWTRSGILILAFAKDDTSLQSANAPGSQLQFAPVERRNYFPARAK